MGPHPESPVDVQKYIGPCLITQQTRSKKKACPRNHHHHNGKDGLGGGYMSPSNRCTPAYNISNYAWTGVPLISVARNKPHHQQGKGRMIHPPPRHKPDYPMSLPDSPDSGSMDDIIPTIARLAIHAQGAPLILSPKDADKGYYAYAPSSFAEEFPEPPPASSSPSGGSSSDCVSVASEDSGTSENGLPRIIKPRKRRKKERGRGGGGGCEGGEEDPGAIVTLKPYQPLCYRAYPSPPASPEEGRRAAAAYPYPPSARCTCPYCVPPPSTFLTPPDSPVGSDRMRFEEDPAEEGLRPPLVLESSHPPPRPWIPISDRDPGSTCKFTVMCYNILCDKYATRQMYGYCPNWALDWSYRKKHILDELQHFKADIISLQEVETGQFYQFFLPELRKDGYDGIFSPKSRAKTMSETDRVHVDGCAIFYKIDKFDLHREHLMEFNQLAMANAEGSDEMLNRVMTKDNIGLAALLVTKPGAYQSGTEESKMRQALLVCTAHIHWDPEFSDVKLVQTMMLMHELKTFVDDILGKCNVQNHQKMDPNVIPLLLCGDFNSLPDSGVIEFLSSCRVAINHCDFKKIVYKDCLKKLGNSSKSNEFTHPFKISRAYNDEIMPFTNYSYDFKGVIDYVFYSKLHMSVLGVLGAMDSHWLEDNRIHGCPHPHVPSDHFPIVVELQLMPTMPLNLPQLPCSNGVPTHNR